MNAKSFFIVRLFPKKALLVFIIVKIWKKFKQQASCSIKNNNRLAHSTKNYRHVNKQKNIPVFICVRKSTRAIILE